MAYWKQNGKNTRSVDSLRLVSTNTDLVSNAAEFHELEQGIVLDIILNENHPFYEGGTNNIISKIDASRWPVNFEDKPPLDSDLDYSWIGKALIRLVTSNKTVDKERLIWAYPIESNISEYPLINEIVTVIIQQGKSYYTRKLNYHNWTNNNLDFRIEGALSGKPNTILYTDTTLQGKKSLTNYKGDSGYHGIAGQYFVANNKIRTVKRWEGDFLIESRHGQTIHLTTYDKNRTNDIGDSKYKDYIDGGNPMILIRNRQRPLVKEGSTLLPHKKLPPIIGTKQEKNVGGYLEENINHDGSSIHITCGKTISEYVTTCYKKMFGDGEETSKWQGTTSFKFPTLNGDQIVINTDRLILSSRYGETFHYSKKRYAIVTDNEYTVDAHQQVVITTNTKTVINSPAIYLGEDDMTNEPALLGQTTVNWLFELCNWLEAHTHWYKHSHEHAGSESPSQTQLPVQVQQLVALQMKLKTLLSRRVFVTGGGLAPGQNGGSITDGTAPVKIDVGGGGGVPGGWKGDNYRPA